MEKLDFLVTTHTPIWEILGRLALAMLLAMGVGYEREASNKPAGLRTHMLVALAACAFTIVAIELVDKVATGDRPGVRADPTRVIEAVITGVAFLGAGTIIRGRDSVIGITTGASIWLAGAIGLSCGAGYYAIAFAILVLTLFALIALGALERGVADKQNRRADDG